MTIYKDINHDSGVLAYEFGINYIDVVFKKSPYKKYRYSYLIPEKEVVEVMKSLAISGDGLNSFINTQVGKNYAAILMN